MTASWASCLCLLLVAAVESAMKTPADALTEDGYPSEVYTVPTSDGYYLQLDRIPNPGRPAVFVSNPIMSSGIVFLNMGPAYAIAYALYRDGFDVFLGSDRGTEYSQDLTQQNNRSNSPSNDKYFQFTFHEHAVLDNPAFIGKILELTNQTQVTYLGFSMSSCSYFAMASTLPQLNGRIRSAHLMAPALSVGKQTSNAYRLLHPIQNITRDLLDFIGVHKVPFKLILGIKAILCPNSKTGFLCNEMLSFVFNEHRQLDYTANCPDMLTTLPAGGSFPEMLHFLQNANYPGKFSFYDYGRAKNMIEYDSEIPPDYQLQNINIPTYIYRGQADVTVSEDHLKLIFDKVPGFVRDWIHPNPDFGHVDFVCDRGAVSMYQQVAEDMKLHL